MKVFGLLFVLVAVASCSPVSQDESSVSRFFGSFLDCSNQDAGSCLKEHALKVAERLRSTRKISIFDGFTILNSSPKKARSLDILPADPQERARAVTDRLWEAASDLLQKGELEITYGGDDDNQVVESRDLKKKKEEKKKLKMLIPFFLLAKAKALVLITISAIVIAISIAKLALFAKIAFIFKAIAIFKELLAKKALASEHLWAPHVEDVHGHGWEGGWSRSKNVDGSNLAYSAYNK